MKIAVYPGTFDPITNGHIDIINRSLKIFGHVIIAVALNPKKTPLFKVSERVGMIKEATHGISRIEVEPFEGLLVDYVKKKKATAIIRGLRAVSDFECELQMALMNRKLDQALETVFLMPSEEYSYLTSTLIKEVASYGGETKGLVPPNVTKLLKGKFKRP